MTSSTTRRPAINAEVITAYDDAMAYHKWTDRERDEPRADTPKLAIAILLSISLCAYLVGWALFPGVL